MDPLSLKVLEALKNGVKVKEIPKMFGISLDQAKRLSRYKNLLSLTNGKVSEEAWVLLTKLGTKALVLTSLAKEKDWPGLNEILHSVSPSITRDELSKHIPALREKMARINKFQNEVDLKLSRLDHNEKILLKKQEELSQMQNEIANKESYLNKYEKSVRDFLLEHLGVTKDGRLCLAKRLDYRWQKNLQEKGAIFFNKPPSIMNPHYDDWMNENANAQYIFLIKDLDMIAADLLKRWKRGWDCSWNYEKESRRGENNEFTRNWDIPRNPGYKGVRGLLSDYEDEIAQLKEGIRAIQLEREEIQEEMSSLRKNSPKSFFEQVEASNKLSMREIKRHGELQDIALKWLFHQGYACLTEFTLDSGKRIDVIGYNEHGHIIAVEVKASRRDYLSDKKWTQYLDYCDDFYFFLDDSNWHIHAGSGLLLPKGNSLNVQSPCEVECSPKNRESIIFAVARGLSKKFIFGY